MELIKKHDLKRVADNQKLFADDKIETSRAIFQLSRLKALVSAIEAHTRENTAKAQGEEYYVCVTFVREQLEDGQRLNIYGDRYNALLTPLGSQKAGKNYSQVIPILSGCLCKIDLTSKLMQSFKFMYAGDVKDQLIPVVMPGGEGTGLIPPPPPPPSDDL